MFKKVTSVVASVLFSSFLLTACSGGTVTCTNRAGQLNHFSAGFS